MSANKLLSETPGQAGQSCQVMDSDPSVPGETERPPADLPATTERPPTDSVVLSGTLPGGSKAEPSIQVRPASFHHSAVSCTSGGTAVVQRNASGTAPKRTSAGPQAAAPPVCIVSRVSTPGASGGSTGRMPQLARPPWTPLAPGRTMVIALPRTASPRAIAVATRPPPQQQPATAQLPANFHIPAGMVLIRSESGQLMLVSQQALVQVQQQGQRAASVSEPRLASAQVAHVGDNKTPAVRKEDKVTIIRLAAPPSVHKTAVSKAPKPAVVQTLNAVVPPVRKPASQDPPPTITQAPKPAVVQTLNAVVPPVRKPASQDPPPTITQETLENVKKCKNFLVTLIRLASSGSQSADITTNVKGLVKSLLDGSVEAEEFTAQLYKELKSTPQPYLLPFLKKSLPAVRHLTSDPQLFVQQADQPKALTSAPIRPPAHIAASGLKPSQPVTHQPRAEGGLTRLPCAPQVTHQPRAAALRASLTRPAPPQLGPSKNSRPVSKHMVLQSRQPHTGPFAFKQPPVHNPPPSNRGVFKVNAGSYREDDDINDVASMAGVNVREEKAKIFSSGCVAVGSVLQSCQDEPFLPVSLLLEYILHTGQCVGVTDVAPEVTAVLSHATQERLRGLLEKLTAMAQHRKTLLKEDMSQQQVSDVRSQLSFMEDIDTLRKRRQDEEERERLLRIARSRWTTDDPLYQQLKQQAKELQQLEQAQQLHREANITALAAIGPRKKRPLQTPGNQVPVLCRVSPVQRVTRVTLRDLLLCLEEDRSLRHSVILYKALLT